MKMFFPEVKQLYRVIINGAWVFVMLIIVGSCKKMDEQATPDEVAAHRSPSHNRKLVDIRLVAGNFSSPLGVVAVPDADKDKHDDRHGKNKNKHGEDNRLFVIDQVGKIWIIDKHGNTLPTPFLDLTARLVPLSPFYDERGLLGLALHPNFSKNGRFFVNYNAPPRPGGPETGSTWNNLSRISEFRVAAWNQNIANIASERPLLELDDPQSNHNGGTLAFGKDGYLYISIGDGGAANDVAPGHVEDWYAVNRGGNGQDTEANLFGDILRIDVNRGSPYGIPRDNPFVGKRGRDEIYAFGFRNPYRFSFDMGGSHQLFAGDAGQVLYEEVSIVKKGGNYGWNVKEATHCFNAAMNTVELPSCPMFDPSGNRLIDPVIEVNHWQNPRGGKATTVIGGNVYRGNAIREFDGKYIFGTFSQSPTTPNGELFIATPRGGSGLWSYEEIALKSSPNDIGYYLKGFGQDRKGEIYLTVSTLLGPTGTTGKVFKLVPVKKDKKHGEEDDD